MAGFMWATGRLAESAPSNWRFSGDVSGKKSPGTSAQAALENEPILPLASLSWFEEAICEFRVRGLGLRV